MNGKDCKIIHKCHYCTNYSNEEKGKYYKYVRVWVCGPCRYLIQMICKEEKVTSK